MSEPPSLQPADFSGADPKHIAILKVEMLEDFIASATAEDLRRHLHVESFSADDALGVSLAKHNKMLAAFEADIPNMASCNLLTRELRRRHHTKPLSTMAFHFRVSARTAARAGFDEDADFLDETADTLDAIFSCYAEMITIQRGIAERQ